MRVVVIARHPGGATRHRSGGAMDATLCVDKRYLERCAHKIGCLLRAENLSHAAGTSTHTNALLLECIYVVFTQRQVHEVKYSELVNSGATETELQEQLVGGDMTTITMRIPRNLKEAGAEAAALRCISFSAFIRMCMIEELVKRD